MTVVSPRLSALQGFPSHQSTVPGVSVDEDEDAYRHFLTRFHVDIPTVRDPNQNAAKLYHADGWPETYIIDASGRVRRKIVGEENFSGPDFVNYLNHL